jgi:redox-sensitive bicupin YhaK (pirin superfamily)
MIIKRPSDERGHANYGWLDTYHTFSFADYYDPDSMGFRALRVINEDTVQPGRGFGTHPHRDMEIVTYILEGALEHRDSMGSGSVIRPGDVQRMSAGTGVTHSEFNHSKTDLVHLLQIWILPERGGLTPEYEERMFPREEREGRLWLIASPDGRDGSLTIHQDVSLYASIVAANGALRHALAPGRYAWLQVARGDVTLNGTALQAGDGAAVAEESVVEIAATTPAEFLLFDLA